MKVVYFGSDVFLSCFDFFLQEHEVLALYTYHNREDYFTEYSIVKRAKQMGIPIHYEAITPEEIICYINECGCDLFFIAEYNRILTIPESLPEFRGINTHSSLLPQGRSYYPIEAAMEREIKCTGVTMHKITNQLDEGDILDQRSIEVTSEMDSIDIYLNCAAYAREMLENIIKNIDEYWESAQPQREKLPYWKRPDDSLLTLHHDMDRAEARNIFKKYNTMTQVQINGEWFQVTALVDGVGSFHEEVCFLSSERVLYRVKDGHLRLHTHSMEVHK